MEKSMKESICVYVHTHTHTHTYNWNNLLYTRTYHNIVNHLYVNKK